MADENPFRYCGEYYDVETGFIYLRARYYDPLTGRFSSVDPVKDGLNWYAYCNCDPVNFVDPFGLFARDMEPHFYDQDGGITYPKERLKNTKLKQTNVTTNDDEFSEVSSYSSADEAAIAFALESYNATMYLRLEHSCVIYELNGLYYYDNFQLEYPHACLDINISVPNGAEYIGYAHTHPNSLEFSNSDKSYAKSKKGDAYVVVPGGKLYRYNYDDETIIEIEIADDYKWKQLTDSEKILLENISRERWMSHLEKGCWLKCNEKNFDWPNANYERR